MLSRLEHKFKIRRVSKATDNEYLEALKIYNGTTPYEIRTSSNEITYWLTNRNETNGFEIYLFVLYLNDEIIGLSMTTYIKTTKIVIDEYLAVEDPFRLNLVLLSYQSLLQNYFQVNAIEVAFFITEISNKNNGQSVDKESRISMKMLCMEDYGKVSALYYTLPLGLTNHESSFEAFLYLKSNDMINALSNETYLGIIKSIYYDYYITWYTPFLTVTQLDEYKQKVEHYYNLVKNSLISSGKPNISIALSKCETVGPNTNEKLSGVLPTVKKGSWIKYPVILLLILCMPLLLIWGYSYALNYLNIQMSSLSNAIGAIISSILTAAVSLYLANKKS